MEVVFILIGVLVAACVWLNTLATIAVKHDPTLEPVQRKGQLAIIWLFPFIGAGFILHLVIQHYPDAIPKEWIPCPLKSLVYGKEPKRNRNRNDDDSVAVNGSVNRSSSFESDIGGDGGGGD